MTRPFGLPGSGPVHRFEKRETMGWLPRGYIDGLTISNDTDDATNDIGIAPGAARSTCRIVDGTPSTLIRDQMDLELPVDIIKQLDVLHAPDNYDRDGFSGGGRSGGRSSSSLANGTWFPILAGGPGMQTDVLLHDGATQALILPELQKAGGYTAYRRIGSILREGAGSIARVVQRGDKFLRKDPVNNTSTAPTTTAALVALSVPLGIQVDAIFNAYVLRGASSIGVYISSPDVDDDGGSITVAPGTNLYSSSAGSTNSASAGQYTVRTDTSGRIRWIAVTNNATDGEINTVGWIDTRDRDA